MNPLKTDQKKVGPELFFGLAGAIGTDLGAVSRGLIKALEFVNYDSRIIHIIEEIHQIDQYRSLEETDKLQRYREHMNAGDDFREKLKLQDGLARMAIVSIREKHRAPNNEDCRTPNEPYKPLSNTAFILRSFKRPEEVSLFRKVYGKSFFLISAYTPRETRIQNLASELASSHYDSNVSKYREHAETLVNRDEEDLYKDYGQKVRDTFPEADFFVDAQKASHIKDSILRFIEILFGNTFLTPTRMEYAMFHAKAAEYRSAELGRQVGAAIINNEGDILAVGTNDVPKFGGGLYWGEDSDDAREFHGGWDTRDRKKEETFAEILKVLKENEWLGENLKNLEIPELVKRATPLLKRTRLFNLIEFGRATHAEMEALLSAARRGISIKDCTLYTTTFPCHDCARHIVASGIRKVVYIEPYAKSLASQFHLDSFLVDQNIETSGFVSCHSFVGIAPRVYMELFPMLQRKDKEGRVKLWNREIAIPRMHSSPLAYMDNEAKEAKTLSEKMNEAGFKPI